MITMGPTLLLFTRLSKEKELLANNNKEPQFYCNNKGAYTTSIHVYLSFFFFYLLLLLFPSQPCQMVTSFDTYCSRHFNFPTFFKLRNSRVAIISCYKIYLAATSMQRPWPILIWPRPVGTHIQYLYGYVPPNRSCFWSSWLRTEYPFYRCFLYWGTIFRTHRATVS